MQLGTFRDYEGLSREERERMQRSDERALDFLLWVLLLTFILGITAVAAYEAFTTHALFSWVAFAIIMLIGARVLNGYTKPLLHLRNGTRMDGGK